MPYIARDAFVVGLLLLDFSFLAETKRSHVYARAGRKIAVPKVEHLDAEWARAELRRCGLEDRFIEAALKAA